MKEDMEEGNPIADQYRVKINHACDRIETREDLVEFVALLAEGYGNGAFDENDVAGLLEAVSHVLDGLPSLCGNQGREIPKQPNWRWVGEILLCALYR